MDFMDRTRNQNSGAAWVQRNLNSEIKQDWCQNPNEQVPGYFDKPIQKHIYTRMYLHKVFQVVATFINNIN